MARRPVWDNFDFGDEDECWPWKGYVNDGGYGVYAPAVGVKVLGHRYVWNLFHGEDPKGLDLDHLCRNRACVNPSHLEPVTRRENLLRGETLPAALVARTHCNQGHPFTPDNLKKPRGRGRECRACDLDRKRRAYLRRRAA